MLMDQGVGAGQAQVEYLDLGWARSWVSAFVEVKQVNSLIGHTGLRSRLEGEAGQRSYLDGEAGVR
jgi:hypothetical protein